MEDNYVVHVMLPCPVEMIEQCRRRKVLKLTSSCCLFILLDPLTRKPRYEEFNVCSLKELKMVGYNYGDYPSLLSPLYLDTLKYFFHSVSAISLTYLEILFDSSQAMATLLQKLDKFVNLKRSSCEVYRHQS